MQMFGLSLVSFARRGTGILQRIVSLAVLACVVGALCIPAAVLAAPQSGTGSPGCQLNSARGDIQHVIFVQFDNTHFVRDNPNVPSDLEQMPHLLNFLKSNGVLLTNHHTPLISHTATDILTTLTGVYPDEHGVPVSNSFRYFLPNGTSNTGVSFAYWTSPLFDPSTPASPTDTKYNMLTSQGKNAPAPWVAYTRAGCNFGAVGVANTVLENTALDVPTVFGANSAEAAEVASNPGQAFADFVGIGVHCAANDQLCASGNSGRPDLLPDEPGGYSGFNGLFGHKYLAPQISPNGPLTDLNGNVIQDATGHVGFPGFDGMSASVSLAYVAAMQEHGVRVTYAYISDVHDRHPSGPAYGPGEAGYVAALKAYDEAFAKFFARLVNEGLTSKNTLFVFTADEGDHFVGGQPTPRGCDGVTTPCTYSQIGEINANMAGLLATQQGVTTPFKVHSDSAPAVYINGNPARDAIVTRNFERATAKLTPVNPMTGKTDILTRSLADPVEMKLLHMVTADPARTPNLIMFANPDYFLFAGPADCNAPCVTQVPAFAWNHGDTTPDITTTWLGIVGPGVRAMGVRGDIWSDHTDVRPTILTLVGLQDDYVHAGRALIEVLYDWAVPQAVRAHRETLLRLARTYKQINAPLGDLGRMSLQISTDGLASGDAANDGNYVRRTGQLTDITTRRDKLAGRMISALEAAEYQGKALDEQPAKGMIAEAQGLLKQVSTMAAR